MDSRHTMDGGGVVRVALGALDCSNPFLLVPSFERRKSERESIPIPIQSNPLKRDKRGGPPPSPCHDMIIRTECR